jgi:phenylacetic acid degradation operon negative regulatory protein
VSRASHATDHGLSLPRAQTGPTPQHLIVTLLGDYWLGRAAPLPSSAFLALTGEFGITETSARAARGRLTRRGLLSLSRVGRRPFYAMCEQTQRELERNRDKILSFGATAAAAWDGAWTVVAFSVPEDQRHLSHLLRARLRWLGFAALYDGVWVSPRGSVDDVGFELERLGIEQATVFRATAAFPPTGLPGDPATAWDVEALRRSYQDFVARFAPMRDRARTGRVSAAEALVARTEAMDIWRGFPGDDPDLPPELLPDDWARVEAHQVFVEIYDRLGPLGETRFREILGEHAPELVRLARHHTSRKRPRSRTK